MRNMGDFYDLFSQIDKKMKKLPSRSVKPMFILGGVLGISSLVLACLLEFPGSPTLTARDFGITVRQVYDIAKCWCRNTAYIENHKKLPIYLTQERRQFLAEEIRNFLRNGQSISQDQIRNRLMEVRSEEMQLAYNRSRQLRLRGLMNLFSRHVVHHPPSDLYVRRFVREFRINLVQSSGMYINRANALYASNIMHWFNNVNTEDLLEGVRKRCIFNMDEAMVQWDEKSKIAKIKGVKRTPFFPSQLMNYHLTVCATVSPGARSPPPFFIQRGLQHVPEEFNQFTDDQSASFIASKSGFINKDIFLEYIQMFINWTEIQRQNGYFTQDEPVLLILDGHKSRGNDAMHNICQVHNIRVVTLPGALTSLLQLLDVGIFSPFRKYFRKQMQREIQQMKYKNNTYFLKLTLTQKRIISVRSTIDGLQQSTTSLSRKNSFETTRLFPRNPVIPTSKDDAIKDLDNPIYPNGRMSKNSAISARVLVTPLKRQRTLLVQEDKEQLEKLKNQNEEQLDEQDTGTKRRRLNDNSFITETNLNVDKQQPSRKQQEKRKIYYKNNPNIPKSELLDDLATLQSELQIEGAYVMNNRGNGNCLFLAIADQLRSRHLNARQIRLQVYEYMLEHGELYEEGFTEEEDIEQYINSMRNDGYYGDGRLFAAICAKFGVRIRIRMIGEVVFDEGDASAPIVELGYIGHIHYVSIRRE